jgi:hypothetical protein
MATSPPQTPRKQIRVGIPDTPEAPSRAPQRTLSFLSSPSTDSEIEQFIIPSDMSELQRELELIGPPPLCDQSSLVNDPSQSSGSDASIPSGSDLSQSSESDSSLPTSRRLFDE